MFIGSGAIEGGIKAIVVQRAKQSGMHWTVRAPRHHRPALPDASGRRDELWSSGTLAPAGLRAAI